MGQIVVDHDSPEIQQRLAALVRSAKEQMGVPEMLASRSGSPVVVPTGSVKQPSLNSKRLPWRQAVLQPQDLGERPPLEASQLRPAPESSDQRIDPPSR